MLHILQSSTQQFLATTPYRTQERAINCPTTNWPPFNLKMDRAYMHIETDSVRNGIRFP